MSSIERRALDTVKRLRWVISRKYISVSISFLRNAPFSMFDGVLNKPLEYAHFVYIV